ncbi:MAG: ankyrin repeat domain-containing protein [Candidatus Sulfotelmatobacter sp.]
MAVRALTPPTEETKELVRLCRTGRLYDLERMIAEGKLPEGIIAKRKTLLQIAVETGFHSLVELIAKHEHSQTSRDAALADCLSSRRLDLVELLIENGAQIAAVPFADVLLTWEPKLIRFFLDRGADPIKDQPFAVAFGAKVRTALRPFVEYIKAHPEHAEALQEQANIALRYFCYEGDLKWISLMLWAGADARSMGPSLEKEYTYDPECYTSGLEQASYAGNVEVLKKLKPQVNRDNLEGLLHDAAISGKKEALHYLLEIGAKANNQENGGSSALDTCLWRLNWGRFNRFGDRQMVSKYEASGALECLQELLAHGAVWNPGEQHQMTSLRRALCECEPEVTVELLRLFHRYNACPAERIHKLLGTPRIREHLAPVSRNISGLGIHFEALSTIRQFRTATRKRA